MAPSLFNTQPWRFRLCPDRIEVHPDLGRRLIAHDPEDRELRIACGAALFNLRLAVHAQGITPVVTIDPVTCRRHWPSSAAARSPCSPAMTPPCTKRSRGGEPTGTPSWTPRCRPVIGDC
jgi:hypothetical protein